MSCRIAHLVLGYRYPTQLKRLINHLRHPNTTIFIHIDSKSPLKDFDSLIGNRENIRFLSARRDVIWGGYSMVQTTIDAFHEIIANHEDFDFINLLSESDYPLRNATTVHSYLSSNLGKSFMEMRFEGSPWWEEAQQKIRKYHFVNYRLPGKYLAERIINAITAERKLPLDMVFTGYSQWMTLSIKHVKHILSFVNKNPKAVQFFKHTWGPDEFFFQTILYNSHFREEIINDNLRYIKWVEGKHSPEILTQEDFATLANSGKLYARKFNIEIDGSVLDTIDQRLLKQGETRS
ncbi:beta-1,6-N-acetylglucosaminyltransferase [Parapedobacter soli]|uniref:beta-1,6-N-acetylglucosaminyltransferase n=1 Tax=Parapedobacter soli TaxID=416955 RepID=UPI0021C9F9AC|nr:beta-1,6-N-acetylglucosaminyltransferase [Parapedobacter soli]